MITILIDKYQNAEMIYDDFVNSEVGQKSFQAARRLFRGYNAGGSDTDFATDSIMFDLENYLLSHGNIDSSEYESWFSQYRDEITENIFAGLT